MKDDSQTGKSWKGQEIKKRDVQDLDADNWKEKNLGCPSLEKLEA